MKSRRAITGVLLLWLAGFGADAHAQTLLIATQDPESVGAGQVQIALGLDYSKGVFYPVSGLHGDLTRFGTLHLGFGVSSIAEIFIDGGVRNRLAITMRDVAPLSALVTTAGSSTGDVEDGVIGAKVRLRAEAPGRPSLAARFSTRLPNSKHPSGLGMDTMDFALSLLTGKTLGGVRLVGNAGWSILEDPIKIGIQNDVITYGGSIEGDVRAGLQVFADVSGRWSTRHGTPPLGTESRAMTRVGARLGRGAVRYDALVLVGLTQHDPSWGIGGGFVWVFAGFKVP